MEIRIQTIHFDASQQLEEYVQKKVSKLEKYHEGILSVEVVLKVVKPETANNKESSVKVIVAGQDFYADKICDSFEESIAECMEALEKQLLKSKEKLRGK